LTSGKVTGRDAGEQLLYRRQFAIGPRFLEELPSWRRLSAGPYRLTVHPGLPTCQVADGDLSITLLGYMLDPERWQLADEPILRALLPELAEGRLARALSRLGGRWVLVADTPRETLVFNDAFGLRQVHYTVVGDERWCASQPGLLAATLDLPVDARAVGAVGHCANREFWLPGPRTIYGEVFRLTPNHSLELRSGRVERYWPAEPCRPCSLDAAIEAATSAVQGFFRAAHARFALAQTITAGWDSRLSLAASRAISRDVFYVSMRYWNMPSDHADLSVPAALLPALGLEHHVIECPDAMEPAFERLYMQSVIPAHYAYGTIAQGMHDHWPAGRVCVKSNVAETVRRSYVLPQAAAPAAVKADEVLRRMSLAPSAFLTDSLDEWLRATVPRLNGFDISDLFYWEQRLGAWQAASQHEWDIVVETFDPLNCRGLLEQLLSVPHELRGGPGYTLHRRTIERMWPEALSAPINPQKSPARPGTVQRLRDLVARLRAAR
jgi:hypothetical protein